MGRLPSLGLCFRIRKEKTRSVILNLQSPLPQISEGSGRAVPGHTAEARAQLACLDVEVHQRVQFGLNRRVGRCLRSTKWGKQ